MKLIKCIVVLATGLLANRAPAIVLGPLGPLTIQLTGKAQDQNATQVKSNPPTFKWSTTNSTYTTEQILDLLRNSFNTSLPTHGILAVDPCGNIAVTDETGTNVFLYVGSVLTFEFANAVFSGQNVDDANGGLNIQLTAQCTLRYDDSSKSTGDGTTTSFTLTGQVIERQTFNNHTGKSALSFSMEGSGYGSFRNHFLVFKGKAAGKAPGTCL
jgi:hypothetical protein